MARAANTSRALASPDTRPSQKPGLLTDASTPHLEHLHMRQELPHLPPVLALSLPPILQLRRCGQRRDAAFAEAHLGMSDPKRTWLEFSLSQTNCAHQNRGLRYTKSTSVGCPRPSGGIEKSLFDLPVREPQPDSERRWFLFRMRRRINCLPTLEP